MTDRYRTGRHQGCNIYDTHQTDYTTMGDLQVGFMISHALGQNVVAALNCDRTESFLFAGPGSPPRDAPAGLRLLADWFDKRDDEAGLVVEDREVQRDLRAWAAEIESLRSQLQSVDTEPEGQ